MKLRVGFGGLNPIRPGGGGGGSKARMTKFTAAIQKPLIHDAQTL